MEENFDALEVIARTRGKVEIDTAPTGDRVFLIWGWPIAVFFALQFACWMWLHEIWCLFVWAGIPLVGTPLMIREMKKDRERTHIRTLSSKTVLHYWYFVCAVCFVGGFLFGFMNLAFVCFYPLIGLLIGIGGFITGEVARFRPMIIGGLAGAVIGTGSFLLQGEPLSSWQLLCVSLVAIVSLVIPGYCYVNHFKKGVQGS